MRNLLAIALATTLALQTPMVAAAGVQAAPGSGQPAAGAGVITGTAQTSAGQPLPNYTVQLRNLQSGQLAGTATTNAAGRFSFSGLTPASYVVEIVAPGGTIVGTSATIAVAAGASVAVTVSAAAAAAAAAAGAGGISTGAPGDDDCGGSRRRRHRRRSQRRGEPLSVASWVPGPERPAGVVPVFVAAVRLPAGCWSFVFCGG